MVALSCWPSYVSLGSNLGAIFRDSGGLLSSYSCSAQNQGGCGAALQGSDTNELVDVEI